MQVESGQGYDLNRSLFERLVLSGCVATQLAEQHRMRPEISNLVRQQTYPTLRDAPKVLHRADVLGLQYNVVFVNHDFAEGLDDAMLERNDDSLSKINVKEAKLACRLALYLQQQYKQEPTFAASDIAVLTPYLAQLAVLREELAKHGNITLGKQDVRDLAAAGVDVDRGSEGGVRAATVDNFQGEEARFVIISLVRSNTAGDIGFVKQPERVNVMLSRARDGMIVLGNEATFRNARSKEGRALWSKVLEQLRQAGGSFDGVPIVCARHKYKQVVKSADEFDQKAPHGGCVQLCNEPLPQCQTNEHVCQLKCHFGTHGSCPRVSTQAQCGHQITHACGERAPPCPTCLAQRLREEKANQASIKKIVGKIDALKVEQARLRVGSATPRSAQNFQ